MFNLSGSELVFLVLIALVVLGPDKLPEAMRKAGKAYADFKKMTSGFQSEMRSVLDEPMRELRETAELAKKAATWDTNMLGSKPVSGRMADHTPAAQTPSIENPAAQPAAAPIATPAPTPTSSDMLSDTAPAPASGDATTRRLAGDSAVVASGVMTGFTTPVEAPIANPSDTSLDRAAETDEVSPE